MIGVPREKKYGYRPVPQVSASQMAEYVSATPTRRRSIIRDAKFPKTSVVALYDRAREGLVNFLGDGTRSYRHLAEAVDQLSKRRARQGASDWIQRDSQFSMEAIDAFQRAYNKLGFAKLDCRQVHGSQPPLNKWATRISVALDLTVHKTIRDEEDHFGGAIFLFSRGESSTKSRIERSKTVAGLIYVFCGSLKGYGVPDPDLCLAVDVFGGVAHRPQGTFARKAAHIAESCDEIAARWPTIGPPDDYDGPDPS